MRAANVIDPILAFAVSQPEAVALVEGERDINYATLARLVRGTARHLRGLGLQPGTRVGLCLKDSAAHVIAMLGVACMGGVGVTLDWRAKPGETGRFIKELGMGCVLIEPGMVTPQAAPCFMLDAAWDEAVAGDAAQEVHAGRVPS